MQTFSTGKGQAATPPPEAPKKPFRLTPSEIESLRQEMQRASAEMKTLFRQAK